MKNNTRCAHIVTYPLKSCAFFFSSFVILSCSKRSFIVRRQRLIDKSLSFIIVARRLHAYTHLHTTIVIYFASPSPSLPLHAQVRSAWRITNGMTAVVFVFLWFACKIWNVIRWCMHAWLCTTVPNERETIKFSFDANICVDNKIICNWFTASTGSLASTKYEHFWASSLVARLVCSWSMPSIHSN